MPSIRRDVIQPPVKSECTSSSFIDNSLETPSVTMSAPLKSMISETAGAFLTTKTVSLSSSSSSSSPSSSKLSFIGVAISCVPFIILLLYYYSIYADGPAEANLIFHGTHNSPIMTPIVASVSYLAMIYIGNIIMSKFEPLQIPNLMFVYNLYQTILNIICVVGLSMQVAKQRMPIWASHIDTSPNGFYLGFFIWIHYHNKYVEFFDTLFMVLRKSTRQISFLHVYHHVLLAWSWWFVVSTACGGDAYFGALINSCVHVVMYSYYTLRLLHISVPWKPLVTKIQLIQFCVCLVHALVVYYYDAYPRFLSLLQLFVMVTMLILFGNFFVKTYHVENKSAEHKKNEIWTIIDGVKYDISEFINIHPGGSDMVMLAVGRDSSVLFNSYHRNMNIAEARLKSMPLSEAKIVPDVVPNVGITCGYYKGVRQSKLYNTIRSRVNEYFAKSELSSKGGMFMMIKSVLTFACVIVLYFVCMRYPSLSLFVSPFLGIALAICGLAIQHDANHGSFSSNIFVNRLAAFLDDFIGGSGLIWRHQHNIAHHVYPNDVQLDCDSFSKFPILRLNPELPLRWYLRYQHIYGPILYSFLGLMYPLGDIANFVAGRYDHIRLHKLRLVDKFTFIFGKCVHYFMFVVVPVYLYGWDGLLKFFLPMQLVGGNVLASVFAVSHNSEMVDYNVSRDVDWAEVQIRTSCNWSVHSNIWWLVSGGLNFQIEHHLFPGVSHVHYPAISEIVREICVENNLPYNSYPSFWLLYKSHIKTLYALGCGNEHKLKQK